MRMMTDQELIKYREQVAEDEREKFPMRATQEQLLYIQDTLDDLIKWSGEQQIPVMIMAGFFQHMTYKLHNYIAGAEKLQVDQIKGEAIQTMEKNLQELTEKLIKLSEGNGKGSGNQELSQEGSKGDKNGNKQDLH